MKRTNLETLAACYKTLKEMQDTFDNMMCEEERAFDALSESDQEGEPGERLGFEIDAFDNISYLIFEVTDFIEQNLGDRLGLESVKPRNEIREQTVLAVGSPGFAGQLAAIFKHEGWEAKTLTNKKNVPRFLRELDAAPQYLVTDSLKDWVVKLAHELDARGTEVYVSGFVNPADLSGRYFSYHSVSGLPSKVADVILGTQFTDEDIDRILHGR